jgi:methylthioribose-1-phosphate isomerase
VADAIRNMIVRGAPAIGVAAAMGIALGIQQSSAHNVEGVRADLAVIADAMAATRPTAVNLFWAIRRMKEKFESVATAPVESIRAALVTEAQEMLVEDIAANQTMGRHGAMLMPASGGVLTHCNAGALATCGYGTALGVIRAAVEAGKRINVFADETRPFLQGARLTAWELARMGAPFRLLVDGAAASVLARGLADIVLIGADRIAANGDTANKVGSIALALAARHAGVPFLVVAPETTVDAATPDGTGIEIEERGAEEVTVFRGVRTAPVGTRTLNPAFDVTPASLITAIVTDLRVIRTDRGERPA